GMSCTMRFLVSPRGRASRCATVLGAIVIASPVSAHAEPPVTWPVVEVSVRAPGLPVLEQRAAHDGWESRCVPPCTLRLDPALQYRIGGDGLVESDPFRVPLGPAHAKVDVSAGSPML